MIDGVGVLLKNNPEPKFIDFINQFKNNTQQIIKYLINLLSFALNNSKIFKQIMEKYMKIYDK